MSKLAGFFKKPLALVICVVVLALGLVSVIVPCVIPHGGTYTGTITVDKNEQKVKYVFKDNKVEVYTDGEKAGELDYVVYKGRFLYGTSQEAFDAQKKLLGDNLDEYLKEMPKINGLTITQGTGDDAVTLRCVTDIVFLAIGCLVTLVGAAGTVLSVTLYVKGKKKSA